MASLIRKACLRRFQLFLLSVTCEYLWKSKIGVLPSEWLKRVTSHLAQIHRMGLAQDDPTNRIGS
jgi:hypothetical protein